MRCYMPVIMMVVWALLVQFGLDPRSSFVFFVFALAIGTRLHIREMKLRFEHLHKTGRWW